MAEHTQPPINPLMQFYRKPEVYVRLPSNGFYNESGEIEFTPTYEVEVSAMTTNDELLLKTPEALLNGDAIAKIIKSCVPGIKNPYNLVSPDIDVLLIAIRKASYGDEMEFRAECPLCEQINEFAISLDEALGDIAVLDNEYKITLNSGLIIHLSPRTYAGTVKEVTKSFEEAQIVKMILEEELEEAEKETRYKESLNRIADLVIELNTDCITKIIGPDQQPLNVSNEQIFEWFKNISRKDAEVITSKINEINTIGLKNKATVVCKNKECKNEWEALINFDPSHFFE